MRRIPRKITSGEYDGLGDTSTLPDPDVMKTLSNEHRRRSDKE